MVAGTPKTAAGLRNVVSAIQAGQWAHAISLCEALLESEPELVDAHYYLAAIHQHRGDADAAIRCYRQVVHLNGTHTGALNNLGTLLEEKGDLDGAATYYAAAVQSAPNDVLANYNHGRLLRRAGSPADAIRHLELASRGDPGNPTILRELALCAKSLGQLTDAMNAIQMAIGRAPTDPELHNLHGNILQAQGKLGAALDAYQKSLALKPDLANTYNNAGTALIARGDVTQALEYYRKALELRPGWPEAQSNILLAENYITEDARRLYELHRTYRATPPESLHPAPPAIPRKRGKIRVGYISPDFRFHSVTHFMRGLISQHDSNKFDIICFSDTATEDAMTMELKGYASEWHQIYGQSNEMVAKRIRQSGIDILVDLAGHTACNRLPVFALQAAPVQASYLGYPNTTGVPEIQYRITDGWTDPPGLTDAYHTETLIRLPRCFLSYTAPHDSPEPGSPPGNETVMITFGSFNVIAKISPQCIEAWCQILTRVPASRLLLKSAGLQDDETQKRLLARFTRHGIAAERIILAPRSPDFRSHMERYGDVDIALDTYPYNGTTTTCEALWMGVPVVTIRGTRHASRVSATLLEHTGLQYLAANSIQEYTDIAVSLANSPEQLLDIRKTTRRKMQNGPLCDSTSLARAIESAYLSMLDA